MSKPSTQIVVASLPDSNYSVYIPSCVHELREQALLKAKTFEGYIITSNEQQQLVAEMAAELKGLVAAMEKTREFVKEPFLRCGQSIDAIAKDYKAPLIEEVKKLEDKAANWIKRERDRVRRELEEMERKRREAQAALEAEMQRAEFARRAAEEAERKRVEAELAAEEAATRSDKAKAQRWLDKAAVELQAAEDAVTMAELAAGEAAESANAAVVTVIEEPTNTGGRMREKFEFMVTDIEALYAWDKERRERAREIGRELPTFLKIEVKKRDFDQYINIIDDAERDSIPGVEFTAVGKFHSNITSPKLAIE